MVGVGRQVGKRGFPRGRHGLGRQGVHPGGALDAQELGIQAVAKAQICDGRHSNAGGGVPCVSSLPQQMEKDMAATIKTSATSEQVREPTRELTEDQLEQVSGGIIAILIGLLLPSAGPSAPPSPTRHPV